MGTDGATDTAVGVQRRVVTTACRLCAVGCGVLVTVDDDRVVEVRGDAHDPVSAGYTCGKGRGAPGLHHGPDRLDHPMIRRDGELVRVSWDEALDDIAARIRAIQSEHGVDAIADYVGTGGPIDPAGYAMAHGFFRALQTTQHYSALSIDCSGQPLVAQLVTGAQLPYQPDLERTPLLLALGVNTVVSHGHGLMIANPLVRIRELRARGAKLVVVDPRLTETAHHADLHLAIRPGTDPALLAHLVRQLLIDGRDDTYLAATAEAAAIERLRAAVAPFDRDAVAAVCDVPAAQLDELVALIRAAGRVAIEAGTGTTLNRAGTVTEWLTWALAGVTGSLDRAGGNTFNPGFLRAFEDALPAGRGDLQPGAASRPELPRIVNGELPCSAMTDELESGSIQALFVRVGNLALALPDAERFQRAAASLELLVAIDVRHTETTALATHVLPMADHLERGDLVTGYLQAAPFMRWAPAAVEPVAERRSQWWMFAELGRRLGLPMFSSPSRDAALRVRAAERGRALDDADIAEAMLQRARHDWTAVSSEPYGLLDDSLQPGWLIPDRLPQRLDLAPVELVGDLAALGLAGAPSSRPLVLINRRTSASYNSLTIGRDTQALLVHPDDAARLGLADGALADVSTSTGSCRAMIEVTTRIRPGVVSLPHGRSSPNVNRLTSSTDADRRSGMPVLSGFAVEVTPAGR